MIEIKPITIDELSKINSIEKKKIFEEEKLRIAVAVCISEINEILQREWHNASDTIYPCEGFYTWGYSAFNEAEKRFKENGIEISYYQPHGLFSFRLI